MLNTNIKISVVIVKQENKIRLLPEKIDGLKHFRLSLV